MDEDFDARCAHLQLGMRRRGPKEDEGALHLKSKDHDESESGVRQKGPTGYS